MNIVQGRRNILSIDCQDRFLREPFRIANEEHFDVTTLTVTIESNGAIGRGECNPFSISGWSHKRALGEIESVLPLIEHGIGRLALLNAMEPGPARNAVDCALFDLECAELGLGAGDLLGVKATAPIKSAQTAGLSENGEILDFRSFINLPIIKLKIDRTSDTELVSKLREAAPSARIIVDANGSLDAAAVEHWLPVLKKNAVEVFEQPMASGEDSYLRVVDQGNVALCADESFQSIKDLATITGVYDMVNVKLDKVGGITAASQSIQLAQKMSLRVMVGCMMGSSLSAAPAWWLSHNAEVVDIDGPTLLSVDVDNSMSWKAGLVSQPTPKLWG